MKATGAAALADAGRDLARARAEAASLRQALEAERALRERPAPRWIRPTSNAARANRPLSRPRPPAAHRKSPRGCSRASTRPRPPCARAPPAATAHRRRRPDGHEEYGRKRSGDARAGHLHHDRVRRSGARVRTIRDRGRRSAPAARAGRTRARGPRRRGGAPGRLAAAQGALIEGVFTYDLTIRGVGTFAVFVEGGSARAVPLARRRHAARRCFISPPSRSCSHSCSPGSGPRSGDSAARPGCRGAAGARANSRRSGKRGCHSWTPSRPARGWSRDSSIGRSRWRSTRSGPAATASRSRSGSSSSHR